MHKSASGINGARIHSTPYLGPLLSDIPDLLALGLLAEFVQRPEIYSRSSRLDHQLDLPGRLDGTELADNRAQSGLIVTIGNSVPNSHGRCHAELGELNVAIHLTVGRPTFAPASAHAIGAHGFASLGIERYQWTADRPGNASTDCASSKTDGGYSLIV
jgi:hypothetical protein